MVTVKYHKIEDMNFIGYTIHSYWGPRPDSPELIAKLFLQLIDRLATIDPVFNQWIYALDEEPILLDPIRGQLESFVERHVARDDDGEPTPVSGYSVAVVNAFEHMPRSLAIYVKAGSRASGPYFINFATIETSDKVPPDPTTVTYPIFRSALFALAETFEVTWCSAYPDEIAKVPRNGKGMFRAGWMNYIAPRFASLITPPQSAIVEYRPNGALFMAATDETFVTSNPQHLAVARDIEAAIAPLNALPWPPDAEPA